MNKQTDALELALEAAYLAGFNDSAEGYNGEYPFRDHGATPTKDRHWVERRDAHIREALAEQPAHQQDGETIVQTFTGLPKRKLSDLLAAGWQINGVCFQRTEADGTVRRGAATTGGMVLWWNSEQPAQPEPSHSDLQLAEQIMSDCGCSTNNQRLLERITERLAKHRPAQQQEPEKVGRITANVKDMVLRQEVMLYTDDYLPIGTAIYTSPPAQPQQEPVAVAYFENITGRIVPPDDTHRRKFPMCYRPLVFGDTFPLASKPLTVIPLSCGNKVLANLEYLPDLWGWALLMDDQVIRWLNQFEAEFVDSAIKAAHGIKGDA